MTLTSRYATIGSMIHRPDPRSPGLRPKHRQRATRRDLAHERMVAALDDVGPLMVDLARLLPEAGGDGPTTGVIGRHAPESSPPWQSEAATAYWGIHFGVRRLANDMRRDIGLAPVVWRGHDDATGHVLGLLRNYAAVVCESLLAAAASRLEGWATAARQVRDIDTVERWVPVPVAPGARLPCPFCRTYSLRMAKRRGEVRCFYPGCVDSDGTTTRAAMEVGRASGEAALVFGDGREVNYRDAEWRESAK